MRKLSDVWDGAREAVVPVVCWRFSTEFSAVGSGRKRGPTLLETHNENSAAATTAARKIEVLATMNRNMNRWRCYQKRSKKTQLGCCGASAALWVRSLSEISTLLESITYADDSALNEILVRHNVKSSIVI